ncbi:MAG: methyltransferase domain-containing protein [Chloroflexi bacterium]|nr:methyltransferase domain-containing protein [Chloroflexota bacterium]
MNENANRPTVEELMATAESKKLDVEGVKAAFEHHSAPGFADQTVRWLPESEYVHELLLSTMESVVGKGGRVLDLGSGTGRLTRLVLDRFPTCSVVAADYSQTMRNAATPELSQYGDRVSQIELDMFSSDWTTDFDQFEAVVSAFAIHHGRNLAQYKSLYRRIHGVLKPNGLFINLDHVAGQDRTQTLANASEWRDFLDEDGEIDSDRFILGSYTEDTPISLRDHGQLLEAVGFDQIEIRWQKMIFALYSGRA